MSEPTGSQPIRMHNLAGVFQQWPRIFALLWETDKRLLIYVTGLQLLQGLSPVASLLAIQYLIDSIELAWAQGIEILYWAFGFFLAITLSKTLVSIFQTYYETLFQTKLSNHLRTLVTEKITRLELIDYENADIQDQLQRAHQESSTRPFQIFKQIVLIVSQVITLLSCVSLLIFWKWWVAFLLILLPLTSFLSLIRLHQKQFEYEWKRAPLQRKSWYLGHLLTGDRAFKEVKIYQLGSYLMQRYIEIFQAFFDQDKDIADKRLRLSLFFELLTLVVISGLILLVLTATYLREITLGSLFAYIQAINLTQSTSKSIIDGWIKLYQHSLFMTRLFSFLDLQTQDGTPVSVQQKRCIDSIETIEFRNVSFYYPGKDQPALTELNFTLTQGQTVAIVGRNGSGKTTLTKLLTQLYQNYTGEILLNGISIRDYDRQSLHQHLGIVFQDFTAYEMDVRHNIGFGNLQHLHDEERLQEASVHAGIDSLIESLPQKFDTPLGRWLMQGHQLSGGQWQRVAIARAFLRNADLYILDEPSSALDPVAEEEIFDTFSHLIRNKIGIFISHRYSSVRHANQIMVMEAGRIVEMGTHSELMHLDGTYAHLYRTQTKHLLQEEESTVTA